MTLIFLSPAASRTTSNSSCSAAASAASSAPAPAAGAAATATGAAAVTPKVSSNCFTNSLSSRRVISLKASSSSSVLSFAMVAFLPFVGCVGTGARQGFLVGGCLFGGSFGRLGLGRRGLGLGDVGSLVRDGVVGSGRFLGHGLGRGLLLGSGLGRCLSSSRRAGTTLEDR